MHFSHIQLRNWKNFADGSAPLEQRVFLIGPNAAGKSNLLDAFRFLHDVASDGLAKAVGNGRGGLSAIRCMTAARTASIEIAVEMTQSNNMR